MSIGVFQLSLPSDVRFYGEVPPAVGPLFVLFNAERSDQSPAACMFGKMRTSFSRRRISSMKRRALFVVRSRRRYFSVSAKAAVASSKLVLQHGKGGRRHLLELYGGSLQRLTRIRWAWRLQDAVEHRMHTVFAGGGYPVRYITPEVGLAALGLAALPDRTGEGFLSGAPRNRQVLEKPPGRPPGITASRHGGIFPHTDTEGHVLLLQKAEPLLADNLPVSQKRLDPLRRHQAKEALHRRVAPGSVGITCLGQELPRDGVGDAFIANGDHEDIDIGPSKLPVSPIYGDDEVIALRKNLEKAATKRAKIKGISAHKALNTMLIRGRLALGLRISASLGKLTVLCMRNATQRRTVSLSRA